MKKIIISFLIIGIILPKLYSQDCSLIEAKNIAENTIKEKFPSSTSSNSAKYKIKTLEYNEDNKFYLSEISPQGFIIISESKNLPPILAFSYESNFDIENNPSAKFWINKYTELINYKVENNISASATIINEWERLSSNSENFKIKLNTKSVEPLLFTKWNQGKFYNAKCPSDPAGPDKHAVTGCVATALGQLINYFRYPLSGIGSYGYEHQNYGWQEVDFSEQYYDYDQMPIQANDYNDNLATLLYNIGVSVDMNYGPNGSGMYNHKGAYTLYTYFDYSPSTTYLFRDSLPEDFDWTGTLVEHLDQNIPLYYAGWGDYDFISGHAFIFDGYSDTTHYHINWGWGGNMDGYFYIENLKPSGSDFTLFHEVIVNATPNNSYQGCAELKTLKSFDGIIEDGSGPLNKYENNLECSWLIAPEDSISGIKFQFLKFALDENDYLIFYEGDNETDPIAYTIYGEQTIDEFIINSEKVLIKFISDDENTDFGWLLKYSAIQPTYCTTMSNITEPQGIICDGSNSYQYRNATFCNWKIQAPNTENILISFLEFDIEPINDYVRILNSEGQNVGTFSGDFLPEDILINGNKATVVFKSNETIRGEGFKLQYQTNVASVNKITEDNFKIYPNPVSDILNITADKEEKYNINILSIDGKSCLKKTCANNSQLNIEKLKQGVYIIEINSENFVYRKKFIKN